MTCKENPVAMSLQSANTIVQDRKRCFPKWFLPKMQPHMKLTHRENV